MNAVEPIRDLQKINEIRKVLRLQSVRNELLFVFGINVGLRISDLLKLTWRDVNTIDYKDYIQITEKKTKKTKRFYINDIVSRLIQEYAQTKKDRKDHHYIFDGRKGDEHITRQHAYLILNSAFESVGLTGAYGTHTLRKTFGYHAYTSGVQLELLMSIFNHSSAAQTLKYIGITEENKKDVYFNLRLGE